MPAGKYFRGRDDMALKTDLELFLGQDKSSSVLSQGKEGRQESLAKAGEEVPTSSTITRNSYSNKVDAAL